MRLAILGFGLIGGSVARALREREPGRWTIAAWSPAGRGPRQAATEGLIDLAAADAGAAIGGADLVLLAAPPLACLELLDELAGLVGATLGR
ncbi:MAG: NAD(P)-binding domain-containing protein, partial [Chloroflexota bacterium]|nr:NAD(P)-binding domain-containing protein [Chloroflexota bacterium]